MFDFLPLALGCGNPPDAGFQLLSKSVLYTQILGSRQQPAFASDFAPVLLALGRGIEIDLLELAMHDPLADLLNAFAFAVLLIRVKRFLHTGAAMGSVFIFKAAVQAFVPGGTVAIAIAGQLVQQARHLRSHLVRLHLQRSRKILKLASG